MPELDAVAALRQNCTGNLATLMNRQVPSLATVFAEDVSITSANPHSFSIAIPQYNGESGRDFLVYVSENRGPETD
jgi:hypothetical protein